MKHEHSIKRLLVPGALLMAAAVGLVSSLGCYDLFGRKKQPVQVVAPFVPMESKLEAPIVILDDAAQIASQAAIADGIQQDITGQITGGQMGHGDY